MCRSILPRGALVLAILVAAATIASSQSVIQSTPPGFEFTVLGPFDPSIPAGPQPYGTVLTGQFWQPPGTFNDPPDVLRIDLSSGLLLLYRNVGGGDLSGGGPATDYYQAISPAAGTGSYAMAAVGDLNGDGWDDIVAGANDGTQVDLILSNHTTGMSDGGHPTTGVPLQLGGPIWTLPTSSPLRDLEVADIDGDSDLDIVVRATYDLIVLFNDGANPPVWTTYTLPVNIGNYAGSAWGGARDLTIADFESALTTALSDALPEIAIMKSYPAYGGFHVYGWDGNTSGSVTNLGDLVYVDGGTTQHAMAMVAGYLDESTSSPTRSQDIAQVANPQFGFEPGLNLFRNSGSSGGTTFPTVEPYLGYLPLYDLAAADLDGDFFNELIVAGNFGRILQHSGSGSGTSPHYDIIYDLPIYNRFTVADLNHDGLPDIVTATPFQVLINTPQATWPGYDPIGNPLTLKTGLASWPNPTVPTAFPDRKTLHFASNPYAVVSVSSPIGLWSYEPFYLIYNVLPGDMAFPAPMYTGIHVDLATAVQVTFGVYQPLVLPGGTTFVAGLPPLPAPGIKIRIQAAIYPAPVGPPPMNYVSSDAHELHWSQ